MWFWHTNGNEPARAGEARRELCSSCEMSGAVQKDIPMPQVAQSELMEVEPNLSVTGATSHTVATSRPRPFRRAGRVVHKVDVVVPFTHGWSFASLSAYEATDLQDHAG